MGEEKALVTQAPTICFAFLILNCSFGLLHVQNIQTVSSQVSRPMVRMLNCGSVSYSLMIATEASNTFIYFPGNDSLISCNLSSPLCSLTRSYSTICLLQSLGYTRLYCDPLTFSRGRILLVHRIRAGRRTIFSPWHFSLKSGDTHLPGSEWPSTPAAPSRREYLCTPRRRRSDLSWAGALDSLLPRRSPRSSTDMYLSSPTLIAGAEHQHNRWPAARMEA